ncbi:DMT family transporter [Petrachloros mirabilis]
MNRSRQQGAFFGLAAALLFGISPPFAKLLLPETGPVLTAGLLYLGAGVGLLLFEVMGRPWLQSNAKEAPVRRADAGILAGVILTGGMLGPFLMLFGLDRLSGVLTSLLLNLEAPFTVLVAVLVFREHLIRRELAAVLTIVVAAGILTYQPGAIRGDAVGILAVLAACFCWAIDNNLSQRLSLRDPLVVTRIKTLGASFGLLGLAGLTGQQWPSVTITLVTCVLGLISYGISLLFDMRALRLLGAAREAGFFATAPFIGALVAVPVLGERWSMQDLTATLLMIAGVALLLRAHHTHMHRHEEIEHDHLHHHEEHHNHSHEGEFIPQEPHAHPHRHLPLTHDHPHLSELHHRHEH